MVVRKRGLPCESEVWGREQGELGRGEVMPLP